MALARFDFDKKKSTFTYEEDDSFGESESSYKVESTSSLKKLERLPSPLRDEIVKIIEVSSCSSHIEPLEKTEEKLLGDQLFKEMGESSGSDVIIK